MVPRWLWALLVGDDETDEEVMLRLERREQQLGLPPMKMNLGTYAMYRVFTGLGPTGEKLGCAYFGLHCAQYLVGLLVLAPVPGRDLVWVPLNFVLQCLCYAATTLVACAFIRWFMNADGVYVVEFDPQMPAPKEEEGQLPPPPPEMDMCLVGHRQMFARKTQERRTQHASPRCSPGKHRSEGLSMPVQDVRQENTGAKKPLVLS